MGTVVKLKSLAWCGHLLDICLISFDAVVGMLVKEPNGLEIGEWKLMVCGWRESNCLEKGVLIIFTNPSELVFFCCAIISADILA